MGLMVSPFLPDPGSSCMFNISSFHDYTMIFMILIMSSVLYVLLSMKMFQSFGRFLKSNETLEGLWTIFPCMILIGLAIPSLSTLYSTEEVLSCSTSMKITGHQWFWSYEYEGGEKFEFNSYLTPSSDLKEGEFRLLETDKSVFLPLNTGVRVTVTSEDVIHSWALPSMGIKMDAIPGRLNQFMLLPEKIGVFYGQCSEICGNLHSFMPIKVEVIMLSKFIDLFNLINLA